MIYSDSRIAHGYLRDRVKIYYDNSDFAKYVCDAEPGSLLTDEVWKIRKIQRNTTDRGTHEEVANGGEYNNKATDLTTVKLYTYS